MMFNERNLMHVNVDYCLAMMMLEVLTCMLSLNESLMWSIYRVESCMKYLSYYMLFVFMNVYVWVSEGCRNFHFGDLKVILECWWLIRPNLLLEKKHKRSYQVKNPTRRLGSIPRGKWFRLNFSLQLILFNQVLYENR